MTADSTTDMSEKSRVATWSLVASGGLAIAKFAAALASGSLGLLSEAFHSLLDFVATVMTLVAIRFSDQPADEDHHFGHAKFESVAALLETGLLFLVTGWVVYEAIMRLLFGGHEVSLSWWLFVVVIASIVIDYNRSRALHATAERTSSEALAADALHFRADMWSSCAVLIGLLLIWLGFPFADAVAALVVAGFVALAAYRLGQRTLATLLDAAPAGTTHTLQDIIQTTDGVLALKQLRVRPAGPTLFVDMSIDVARTLPATATNLIKQELIARVRAQFSAADVSIEINPVALDNETAFDKVALVAALHGLSVHHLVVQELEGKLAVSFDLEVDGQQSLLAAHERATALEYAIRDGLGGDVEVESHIEPISIDLLAGVRADTKTAKAVEEKLARLCKSEKQLSDLHNIRVRQNSSGLFVHYHCRFAPDLRVETVHEVIDRVELRLMAAEPRIKRVVAHAEPIGATNH